MKKFENAKDFKKKFTLEDIDKASKTLAKQFYHAFEPMETDLNKIKKMVCILAK